MAQSSFLRGCLASAALTLGALAPVATVHAHHTFVTKYDGAKLITISGVISSVSYSNPHIFFQVSATAKSGNQVTWTVETEGILAARGKGLTEALLKDGAKVSVSGWVGRDGGADLGPKSIPLGGKPIQMRTPAR